MWRPGRVPADAPPLGQRAIPTAGIADGDALVKRLIRGGGRWLIPSSLGSILTSALGLLVPLAVGRSIDSGLVAGDVLAAAGWCVLILVLYGLRCIATGLRLSGDVGACVVQHDLRLALIDRLLDPRGLGGPARLPGDLVSVASTDVPATSRGMTTVTTLPGHAVTVGGSIIALAVLDWRLAAVVAVSVPIIVFVSVRGIRPIRPYTRVERTAEAAASGSAADFVAGLRVVQGLRAQDQAVTRFAAVGDRALAATLRTRIVRGAYAAGVNVVVGFFIVGLTVLAAYLGLAGQLTVGDVAAVAGLAQTMGPPLRSIGIDTAAVFSASQASADRVIGVLETPPALTQGSCEDQPESRRLQLRDVTLAGRLEQPVDLDLEVRGLVAVLSPGLVAEALADLLARRKSPQSGQLYWGEVDLAQLRIETQRRLILAPPHQVDLFDGTLRTNICGYESPADTAALGDDLDPPPDGPTGDQRLAAVLAATTCDEVARTQRDGLDTRVGPEGRTLSGGQRQRVALARALYRSADLLVLHEPTTNVDAVTTARIANQLRQARGGGPTLLLTTTPELLAAADEVVQLDENGSVLRRGRHSELLSEPDYVQALT